ncbi:MAG: helix-turn-helix transcriptional regulator [Pseudomonadota bacterium]
MKTTKKLLGARIKELRRARRLSQAQLAEKIDIDPKHLSRIEVGRSYPSLDRLDKIANALDIEMKDLFEFEHLVADKELKKNIDKLIREANKDKLRLGLRILRAIIR